MARLAEASEQAVEIELRSRSRYRPAWQPLCEDVPTAKGTPSYLPNVSLNRYPDLTPAEGEVETAELVDEEGLLVKVFGLGPGAELSPHRHEGETNVFHVLSGTVTVVQEDETEVVEAPGVVRHPPGAAHGARNEGVETAVFTATLVPTE